MGRFWGDFLIFLPMQKYFAAPNRGFLSASRTFFFLMVFLKALPSYLLIINIIQYTSLKANERVMCNKFTFSLFFLFSHLRESFKEKEGKISLRAVIKAKSIS